MALTQSAFMCTSFYPLNPGVLTGLVSFLLHALKSQLIRDLLLNFSESIQFSIAVINPLYKIMSIIL